VIEAELIEESDERPAPEVDDARRRYYRLTPLGKRVLDAECERLEDLVRTIRVKQSMITE
jgi:DNA-binding PadR family transcriptional regulator